MNSRLIALALTATMVSACGRVAELEPAPGKTLPVKPLMARTTPTPADLLQVPPYARADRLDELMKRSEPRPEDPFNLPPATGGSAPTLPAGSDPQPAATAPVPPGE